MTWPNDNQPALNSPGANLDSPAHSLIHNQAITLLEALRSTLGLNVQGDHSTVAQRIVREGISKVTSDARGAHYEGRLVWDLDLDALLVSDGSSWTRVAGGPLTIRAVRVGINQADPEAELHVARVGDSFGPAGIAAEVARFTSNQLNQHCQITINAHGQGRSRVAFARNTEMFGANLSYDHAANTFTLAVEGTTAIEAISGGAIGIGMGGPNNHLKVLNSGGLEGVGIRSSAGGSTIIGTGGDTLNVHNGGGINGVGVRNNTTGAAANMHVNPSGLFMLSTSARKYKTDIGRLDREMAEELVLGIEPVLYRSNPETNPEDDPDREWVGIIADQVAGLGALGRRLCGWQDESRVDADDLDIAAEVETFQYERLIAPLVATVQHQHERIGQLEERLAALEGAQ